MSNNKQGLQREDSTKLTKLVKFLENRPESVEFLRPVDYKGLGLTDYTTIISKPMDLSTVRKNIRNSVYMHVQEALDDLNLIWENCKTYNPQEHYIYKQAEDMEQHMKEYLASQSWEISVPEKRPRETAPEKRPREIPPDKRNEFVDALQSLPGEEIGKIIDTLNQLCPRAIIKLTDERIQVKVDSIDASTFQKIYEMSTSVDNPLKKAKQ